MDKKEYIVNLEKWPVSFVEWADAYVVQIMGKDTRLYGKNFREGLMDKIMVRIQLLFDSPVVYRNEKGKATNYVMPEAEEAKYIPFVRMERKWQKKRKKKNGEKIGELQKCYDIENERYEELKKRLAAKEVMDDEYDRLENRVANKKLVLNRIKNQIKNLEKQNDGLEIIDLLKVPVFKEVSQDESDFYCVLLSEAFSRRNILTDLADDKWWLIDIEVREHLLRCIEKLMFERKWSFAITEFKAVTKKLLRPHEYILKKETENLLGSIDSLYSVGSKKAFCIWEWDDDMKEEIEYTDISNMMKVWKNEEGSDLQHMSMLFKERIEKLTELMKELSEDLCDYVEENRAVWNPLAELEEVMKIRSLTDGFQSSNSSNNG